MAYSTCDRNSLKDAILRVWTPAVGARSLDELLERNIEKILSSPEQRPHSLIRENIPTNFCVPFTTDFFDQQPPFEIREKILSGSWSEGLYLHGLSTNIKIPDMDFMFVLKHISFSKEHQHYNLTLREDTPFVYVYIKDKDTEKMWNEFLVDQEHPPRKRLSSKKLKEKLQENARKELPSSADDIPKDAAEGAAMYIGGIGSEFSRSTCLLSSQVIEQFSLERVGWINDILKDVYQVFTGCDIVLAISCEGWPSCAREWVTRDRIWPRDNVVQKITQDGFHIVPKSSTEGDFRLSFSSAEITLIENLTELQHKVLRSFKAVVKFYQNSWSSNIKDILTTYHLKTIAFWHFEKTEQDCYTEETVATHLVLLLQKLADAVRKRELPMYFMPKVNLFQNVENAEKAIDITEKIVQLSQDFSLVINALENITTGFGRTMGFQGKIIERVFEGVSKFMPDICEKRGKVKALKEETLNKLQIASKLASPIINMKLPPHKTEPDQVGIGMAMRLLSIIQHFQNVDFVEFIDLD